MDTARDVADKREFLAYIRALHSYESVSEHEISVLPYGGVDSRIGWNTYMVCINGRPFGFCDGPPPTEWGVKMETGY